MRIFDQVLQRQLYKYLDQTGLHKKKESYRNRNQGDVRGVTQ